MTLLNDHDVRIRTVRRGLICYGGIFVDGEFMFGVKNMFTQRGVRKEMEYYIGKLEEGWTLQECERALDESRLGW